MRILFSHYLLDDDCPPGLVVRAISGELRALGHDVLVHRSYGAIRTGSPGGSPDGMAKGGWTKALRGRVWFSKAIARNLPMYRRDVRAIRDFRPEVVLCRQDAYCASMVLAARRAGIPLVTYADAPVAYETRLYNGRERWHPPRLVEAFERWGLRRSQAITTITRPSERKLAEYGLDVPVWVVPNGIHPGRFPAPTDEERRGRRGALGITAPHVLGFQGTFRKFHGIDRLRDIMLGLASRTDTHWLLIGDGPERAALESAVAGRVGATFLGKRPHEEIGALLGLIDVALSPHQYVPGLFYLCPLKVLEYAAAGCAVVACAQGDIPWLLDDGRAGIVLDDPSTATWVEAIERLLDDPLGRRDLGQAARRHVFAHSTWRQVAEQYQAVLRATLEGRPSTQAECAIAADPGLVRGTPAA